MNRASGNRKKDKTEKLEKFRKAYSFIDNIVPLLIFLFGNFFKAM